MKSPSRYVLYTRVSTEGQDDNFSHESQLAALQSHVLKRGGRVVDIIRETASGASIVARPGMSRAVSMLECDEADVLACYDFSRYSRDVEHQQQIARRVESAGKRLEFATFEFARDRFGKLTPESDLSFGVFGSFAAYHRAKIRADSKRGIIMSAEKGLQPNRTKSPFGYRIIQKAHIMNGEAPAGSQGTYEIIEELRPIVVEIFERRAAGSTISDIRDWLNEIEAPVAQSGTQWWDSSLRSILENTVYYGEARYGKKTRVTDDSRLARGFGSRFYKVDSTEGEIVIPAPAIISKELWEKCQSMNRNLAPKPRRHGERRIFFLTGVLVCPICGGGMNGASELRGGGRLGKRRGVITEKKRVRFYACRASKLNYARAAGIPLCERNLIRADDIESRVQQFLAQLLEDPEVLAQLVPSRATTAKQNKLLGELQKSLEEISKREATLIEAQLRAMMAGADSATYETMLGNLGAEKRDLQSKLEAAQKNSSDPKQYLKYAQALRKSLENSENTRLLRHYMEKLFSRVWMENDDIKLEWRDIKN